MGVGRGTLKAPDMYSWRNVQMNIFSELAVSIGRFVNTQVCRKQLCLRLSCTEMLFRTVLVPCLKHVSSHLVYIYNAAIVVSYSGSYSSQVFFMELKRLRFSLPLNGAAMVTGRTFTTEMHSRIVIKKISARVQT